MVNLKKLKSTGAGLLLIVIIS